MMQSTEDFHQTIAARLDQFHGQRLAKTDEVISSLVAENAALRARLKLEANEPVVEGKVCAIADTIYEKHTVETSPVSTVDQHLSRLGPSTSTIDTVETPEASRTPPKVMCNTVNPVFDLDPPQLESDQAKDGMLQDESVEPETPGRESGRKRRQSLKDESEIARLSFMDSTGDLIHPKSLLERHFPCLAFYKKWLSRHLHEPMTGAFARFIQGDSFKVLSALVITLNYLFIVVQSDYKLRHPNEGQSEALTNIGYCFTGFYIFELIAQMAVYGKVFFLGPEVGWNLFDFTIVFVAVVEITVTALGGSFINSSFLRIIRFLRISRVLRMFSAMRMFKEIKVMVDTLSGSFSLFFWCTLFFMLFLSLVGVFFVQGAAAYLEDHGDNPDLSFEEALMENFGSVSRSMLSLFMAATGGNDWINFHMTVKQLGASYDCLFIIFVLFYHVAFINVITSVFCEKAMRLAKPETAELIARRQELEVKDAAEMLGLLKRLMEDGGSRQITSSMFDTFISHPEVELYFEVRGLRCSSAHRFFRLLCEVHETDTVDFATFISACVKLDGYASSIDVHCLAVRQLHGLHQLQAAQLSHEKELKMLRLEMNDISKLKNHVGHLDSIGTNGLEQRQANARCCKTTHWQHSLGKVKPCIDSKIVSGALSL